MGTKRLDREQSPEEIISAVSSEWNKYSREDIAHAFSHCLDELTQSVVREERAVEELQKVQEGRDHQQSLRGREIVRHSREIAQLRKTIEGLSRILKDSHDGAARTHAGFLQIIDEQSEDELQQDRLYYLGAIEAGPAEDGVPIPVGAVKIVLADPPDTDLQEP